MISELDVHFQNCYPPLNRQLAACLDFGRLFTGLCGTRTALEHPVNKREYGSLGAKEFQECAEFVSALPSVSEHNLEFGPELNAAMFWKLKSARIEVVWGKLYTTHFGKFFNKIKEISEEPGTAVRHTVVMEELTAKEIGDFAVSFVPATPTLFTLADAFDLKTNTGLVHQVTLQEDKVIECLYTDSELYSLAGREFCIVFNHMFAKTGTEAIAESLYRVVENQTKFGKQSPDVLWKRSKIDWCLPHTIQCERAITDMAYTYIEGDEEQGLKRHHVPIYSSRRNQIKNINDLSKVLTRLRDDEVKLSFLL
eukprot:Seg4842.1 transcript_id=Seg4842.1/GoldUCD/mRNA.D3Y31 product="hypothetical protein" protein_id=Seg4842.1/GoldUCD/D3Y31